MEIILLQDVKSLGKKGERVKINDGYARNFVLPKKLGIEATATVNVSGLSEKDVAVLAALADRLRVHRE